MKSIKLTLVVTLALAAIGIWMIGFLCGKYEERQHQHQYLTSDSKEFLHGYVLDLPEELIACDSLDNLGVVIHGDTLRAFFKEKGFIMPISIIGKLDSTAHTKDWSSSSIHETGVDSIVWIGGSIYTNKKPVKQ